MLEESSSFLSQKLGGCGGGRQSRLEHGVEGHPTEHGQPVVVLP